MRLVSYIKGNQQILGKKNLGFQNIWGAKEFFCYQILGVGNLSPKNLMSKKIILAQKNLMKKKIGSDFWI